MCEYCGDAGEIEVDNNGPVIGCPLCAKPIDMDDNRSAIEQWADSNQRGFAELDKAWWNAGMLHWPDSVAQLYKWNDGNWRTLTPLAFDDFILLTQVMRIKTGG